MMTSMEGSQGQVSASEMKEEEDIISTMPENILSNIVSRLTIKEAGRTSVLSTKWRYIWTFFFGLLCFDESVNLFYLAHDNVSSLRKCNRFISEWERFMSNVEYVLKSLNTPSLQGIKIIFDMGYPTKVEKLFKFAAEKNVQLLELDCSFHFHLYFLNISDNVRNVLSTYFPMKSLKELRLVSVEVDGNVIQQFLRHCPSLETLYVRDSRCLSRLLVCGDGLMLKKLAIVKCNLDYLYIAAVNLVSFTYSGNQGIIVFDTIPNLVEATFGEVYASYLQRNMLVPHVHKLLSQLNVLKLDLFLLDRTPLEGLPVFNNVNHLELGIPLPHAGSPCDRLNRVVSLLRAFPSICVLKLKFRWLKLNTPPAPREPWKANPGVEFTKLEKLELSSCKREANQKELIKSIIESAPNLRKIVMDPLSMNFEARSEEFKAMVKAQHRDCDIRYANRLKQDVPQHVELVVL